MKRKNKRFPSGFFALFLALVMFFNACICAQAAGGKSVLRMWKATVKKVGEVPELLPGLIHGNVKAASIDGHTAYCLNYGMLGRDGNPVSSSIERRTDLTKEQEKYLMYCLFYGFSTTAVRAPDEEEACAYIATQTMVWNIVSNIWGTGKDDSAAVKICAAAPDPKHALEYYKTLKERVNKA